MCALIGKAYAKDTLCSDKTVQDELVEALVMDAETLKDQTLQEHDRIHHKEGYHEGDTCKFRDKMKEETPEDKADKVSPDRDGRTNTSKTTIKQKKGGISHIFTGSAANYEKPSLLKIGTGEGTQVYGHGLYGSTLRNDAEYYAVKAQANFVPGKGDGRQIIYEQTFFTNRAKGDESHLLSWYEPVSEANRKRIDNALIAISGNPMDWTGVETGQDVYRKLATFASPKEASEFLANNADIDGVKYPAEDHRGRQIGNAKGWNYVSFRDDNIRIDKKYVDGQKMYDYEELMAKHHSNLDPMEVLSHLTRLDSPEEMAAEFARIMESGKIEETVDNKPLVTPEEDAAYMEAVEKGDMETAAKMVREAAAKAMPDTKIVGEDGSPRMLYKGKSTDTTEYEGDIYLSNDIGVAKSYVGRYSEDGRGTLMKAFVDMKTPLVIDASGATFDIIPTPQVLLDKYGVGAKIKTGRLYDAEIFSDTMSLDDIVYFAKDAGYDGVEVRNIIDSNNWNEMYNPPRATTYVAFNSRQIKSADPVTYDDHGNVIPLSRRFDDGDDIRGDVSGKTEYIEKMQSLHPDINPNELINRLKGLGSREEMESEIKKILGKK